MKRFLIIIFITCVFSPAYLISSATATWKEVHSPHFIVRYQGKEGKIASFIMKRGEEMRGEVLANIGHSPHTPTIIYLAPDRNAFQEVQPGGKPPSWSIGVAYPEHNLIVILSPHAQKWERGDIEETLRHEYAHLALAMAIKGNEAPLWLAEGITLLQERGWGISASFALGRGVLSNRLIPLEELASSFPAQKEQAQLAYAQSESFVGFIKADCGEQALPRLIRGLSYGLDLNTAVQQATGLGLRDLERRWRDDLRRRYSWVPIATSLLSVWFVASLLFLIGYFLKRHRAKKIREKWEQEEAAKKHPSPPEGTGEGVRAK